MKNQSERFLKFSSAFTGGPDIPQPKDSDRGTPGLGKHIVKRGVDSTVVSPCVRALVERDKRESDLECEDFHFILFQT